MRRDVYHTKLSLAYVGIKGVFGFLVKICLPFLCSITF